MYQNKQMFTKVFSKRCSIKQTDQWQTMNRKKPDMISE